MNQQILGDKKKRRYDEGLIEVVNKIYAGENSSSVKSSVNNSEIFDDFDLAFEFEKISGPLYFDQSLAGLKNRGYLRHARPKEVFSILIDYEEKGKQSKYAELAESLLSGDGEWLSLAVRRVGKNLEFVLDPENLFFYNKKDFRYLSQGGKIKCSRGVRFI
ncbi:hypothetical protein HY837_06390 [archaeon]|nr:hypothetical protein [archaeon]